MTHFKNTHVPPPPPPPGHQVLGKENTKVSRIAI